MTRQGWNIEARFRVWGPNGAWVPQADYLNLPQEEAERKAAELTVRNTLSEWRAVPMSDANRREKERIARRLQELRTAAACRVLKAKGDPEEIRKDGLRVFSALETVRKRGNETA